jgi:hypothetical protein
LSPLNTHPDDDLVEEARLRAVEKIKAAARENGLLQQLAKRSSLFASSQHFSRPAFQQES